MSEETRGELLCMECGHVTDPKAFPNGLRACPACGSIAIPADLGKSLTLHISEHELRILTIWASNYAKQIKVEKPMRVILDRLGTQTSIPLSMEQEFADLRQEYGAAVKIYDADGNEVT